MRNRLLTPLVAAALMLFMIDSATAQSLRADGTVYLKARVGLNHYGGDRDNNPENDLGQFLEDAGFSLGGELGYAGRFGTSPLGGAIGLTYYGGQYTMINSNESNVLPVIDPNTSSDWRHTLGLMGRLHFFYPNRISPYLQVGAGYTFGNINDNMEGGFTPMGGIGFDIALTDRIGLFIEGNLIASIDDAALDLNANQDDMDWLGFYGGGLRINFRSPFVPIQVIALECPTELQVGETATFSASTNIDQATPPVQFRWNFGDGTTATGEVATHSFATAGTYTVNFTASNQDGRGQSMRSCTVTVTPPPAPAEIVTVTANPQTFDVCQPTTVQFSANVRGDAPITYEWNFGDGTTGQGANPTHTYSEAGTYTVTLTATNQAGSTTRTLTIRAEPCEPAICAEITEMNSVFFGRNSSTLTAEGRAALQENLEILQECPNLNARIEGFAAPGERNPQQLSEDRARAVEQFYRDGGIQAARLNVVGRGQVTGVTTKKEGTSQHRRVDTIPVR
jgi:outer membrane protein OmpA-like peptidoglycan-associated protein